MDVFLASPRGGGEGGIINTRGGQMLPLPPPPLPERNPGWVGIKLFTLLFTNCWGFIEDF